MTYKQLNNGWNADPNAPEPKISIHGSSITLEFYLNYFLFDNFKEGDKGQLTFLNCFKYAINTLNDEGYYKGNYRYKYTDLPWGEFYQINSAPEDFPKDAVILNFNENVSNLKHYLFFFKDDTFECLAEGFELNL